VRKAGRAGDARGHIVESDARKDGDAVPLGLPVVGHGIAAPRQLLAKRGNEGLVGDLGLLEADHIGLTLIQPGQQSRDPRLD